MDSFEKWWYELVDEQEFGFGSNAEMAKKVARRGWNAGKAHQRRRIIDLLHGEPAPIIQPNTPGCAGKLPGAIPSGAVPVSGDPCPCPACVYSREKGRELAQAEARFIGESKP